MKLFMYNFIRISILKLNFHRLMRNNEKNTYKFPEQFTFTL